MTLPRAMTRSPPISTASSRRRPGKGVPLRFATIAGFAFLQIVDAQHRHASAACRSSRAVLRNCEACGLAFIDCPTLILPIEITRKLSGDPVRMDRLASMQVFVQVVDSGTFAAAAKRLDASAATVTHHVQALEDHLGVQLLNR